MQCENEKRWNIFFFFLYPAIAVWLFSLLISVRGDMPTSLPAWDAFIIILAIFRLIRLFVYDRITKFIRDWFEEIPKLPNSSIPLTPEERARLLAIGPVCACDLPGAQTALPASQHSNGDGGEICYKSGFKAAVSHLLSCPWCMGVWLSLPVLFFYFLTPLSWLPILMLAVGSLASSLQLVANLVGWSAEEKKRRTENIPPHSH